jgi:sterol desaturase/sphingolipid hydroxylase (fatty acid hydroxylase superfamily)
MPAWQTWALAHEAALRLFAFSLVLIGLLFAEHFFSKASVRNLRRRRQENFGLMLIDSLLLRLAFPMLAVQFALHYADWGLLAQLQLPLWLACLCGILLLDLTIYWQHRLSHSIPWFWRLHRVHHSDADFDVSLALRFHPLEIVLSMLIKFLAIAAFGVPALAVLCYEVALSAGALFSHTRLHLPMAVERYARWLIITPSVHRIHHRLDLGDQNSNFGSVLTLWDYLFASLRFRARSPEPAFGLRELPIPNGFWQLLLLPFRKI